MKRWVPCWLRVSTKDILVSDTENTAPRFSCPYVEIITIRQTGYNNHKTFCIAVQVSSWESWIDVDEKDNLLVCIFYHRWGKKVVLLYGASVEGRTQSFYRIINNTCIFAIQHFSFSVFR